MNAIYDKSLPNNDDVELISVFLPGMITYLHRSMPSYVLQDKRMARNITKMEGNLKS